MRLLRGERTGTRNYVGEEWESLVGGSGRGDGEEGVSEGVTGVG